MAEVSDRDCGCPLGASGLGRHVSRVGSDRQVTLGGGCRLAGAALLPGALVMSGALVLYGLQRLNFIGLLLAWPLHLVIGWIYTAGATVRLPKLATQLVNPANPFVTRPPASEPNVNPNPE